MVCTDLDALEEGHGSVIQRIVNFKERLLLSWEKEGQLKRDVEAKLLKLVGY